jgi:membrane-associated PAP2 superfamily phosphatase
MGAFLPIHLPWFITLHAGGFTVLGLYFLFKAPPPGKAAGHTPQLGIATTAIGLAYLFTAYMPIEENQWLHASVPVRLVLGLLLGLRAVIGNGLTSAEKRSLLNLGLYDGLGAVVLGLWLGRFDGRLPVSSS